MDWEDLIKYLLEYESDTFSASGAKLTKSTAILIAERLMKNWIDNNLDGVTIASHLEDIEDETKSK